MQIINNRYQYNNNNNIGTKVPTCLRIKQNDEKLV